MSAQGRLAMVLLLQLEGWPTDLWLRRTDLHWAAGRMKGASCQLLFVELHGSLYCARVHIFLKDTANTGPLNVSQYNVAGPSPGS